LTKIWNLTLFHFNPSHLTKDRQMSACKLKRLNSELGEPVADLSSARDEIMAAIDFLVTGF
jgi:hypothetical protein